MTRLQCLRIGPRARCIVLVAAVQICWPATSHADEDTRVIQPWDDLGLGIIGSYTWPTLLFHASAVATTVPLVYSADRPVQRFFQRDNPLSQGFADATLGFGWVAPFALPLGMYLGGLATDATELATAGAAALQAVAVQALIVSTLKWLTDRAGPFPDGDATRARWSGDLFHDSNDPKQFNFNPFDLTGGLRWPSGHTASNIALVSALVAFYPDEPWIPAVGYPLVLAIGLGMIEGDYHWLSDVVAGGLMGHAIGWTIGKHFRQRFDAAISSNGASARAPDFTFTLTPLASDRGAGLSIVGQF